MSSRYKIGALTVMALLLSVTASFGLISEPDRVFYGTITVNTQAVTAVDTQYVVEVRATPDGSAIHSYRMGSDTNYHPYFYGFRMTLEAFAEALEADGKIHDTVYLVLLDGSTVLSQKVHFIEQRGLAREDFGPPADSDNDELLDLDEYDIHGTDPRDPDSDDDLVWDGPEVNTYGSEPLIPDTDMDGDDDGYEVANRTDPTDPAHFMADIAGEVLYGGAQTGTVKVTAFAGGGPSNGVLRLSGTGDYVAVDGLYYDTAGQVTALTVSAWVRTTSDTYNIVASWDRSAAWRLSVGSESIGFVGQVGFDTTDENGNTHNMKGRFAVNDGEWHHLAATYDGATGVKRMYVDGVIDNVATGAHAAGAGLVGGPEIGVRYGFLGIGSDASTFNGDVIPDIYYEGDIDDLQVWNTAMPQAEVLSNMYAGLTGNESALQAWFNFDDGTPNDSSTNAFSALLVNGASIVEERAGYSRSTWLDAAGAYTVTVRTLSDYGVEGFMDSDGSSTQDYWEATGAFLLGPLYLTNDTPGIDLTLEDPDSDSDGLFDYEELFVYGTDPFDTDTDNDNLSDFDEVVTYNTDPNRRDTDRDGLKDDLEVLVHFTQPDDRDTDNDGFTDGWEVRMGTSPTDPLDFPSEAPLNDFNGDAVSDLAVYDEATGAWYIRSLEAPAGSPNPLVAFGKNWGGPGMVPVPGDYDGDGICDLAVYDSSSGNWYIRMVSRMGPANPPIVFGRNWGGPGMVPVPGDYDGDNVYDLAVYDTVTGAWYVWAMGPDAPVNPPILFGDNWGDATMTPVSGDYDGDGVFDLGVYQGGTGLWYVRPAAGGSALLFGETWGSATAVPVPGDYDGDGTWDLACYEPATGRWSIQTVAGVPITVDDQWGGQGMVPVPGDYDGDGTYDLAVYNESTGMWYIRPAGAATPITFGLGWGGAGMFPVQ